MLKLAIVGAQFAEPSLFGSWLGDRHGFAFESVFLNEHDRAMVAKGVRIGNQEWLVHILVRACWDDALAHDAALRDCDRVLVALCRSASTQHLNEGAIESVRSRVAVDFPVSVAINDPHCADPDFTAADPRNIARLIPSGWRVHYTRCGDFYKPGRCQEGVERLFEDLLR